MFCGFFGLKWHNQDQNLGYLAPEPTYIITIITVSMGIIMCDLGQVLSFSRPQIPSYKDRVLEAFPKGTHRCAPRSPRQQLLHVPTCPCTTAILCLHLPLCSEATLIHVCRWELNIHTSRLLMWPPREREAAVAPDPKEGLRVDSRKDFLLGLCETSGL